MIQRFHVYPNYGKEHEASRDCWCLPTLNYVDPDTGNEVWLHRTEM